MGSRAAPALAAHGRGRLALRVTCEVEARLAWGYEQRQARVVEFSSNGLTFDSLDVPVGAVIAIELDLPRGMLALCGRVVHASSRRGGVELLSAEQQQRTEIESYLWDLLAASLKPESECAIIGCDKPRKARGLCSTHYSRWRRRSREATV
ncbi:MAG: PilZ domain-containing protein [Myxococcales bacterium]|nr:PilZ domain-containing protein [Myxococcales bacterium]